MDIHFLTTVTTVISAVHPGDMFSLISEDITQFLDSGNQHTSTALAVVYPPVKDSCRHFNHPFPITLVPSDHPDT